MKIWAFEMGVISVLVEVIHLINTHEEGGSFASETLENLVENVKCQERTVLKRHVFELAFGII